MKKITCFLLYILMSFVLSACVTNVQGPIVQLSPDNESAAIVRNYYKEDMSNYYAAKIEVVDGKKVAYPKSFVGPYTQGISLSPGSHQLTIYNQFQLGFWEEYQKGSVVNFKVTLASSTHYRLHMSVGKGVTLTWLDDENGNRVSDIALAEYRQSRGPLYWQH